MRRFRSKYFWIILALVVVDIPLPVLAIVDWILLAGVINPPWLKRMAELLEEAYRDITGDFG